MALAPLSPDDMRTFSAPPRIIKLTPGSQLCRFVTPGESYMHGRFWMEHQTLVQLTNKARTARVPIHEFARQIMAIKREWSANMLGLIFLRITAPAEAYAGPARHQHEPIKGTNVTYLYTGGAQQIVFPFYQSGTIESEFRKFSALGSYISDIDSLVA